MSELPQLKEYLTFQDVLMPPQFSTIESRSDVDVSVNIKGFKFSNPLVPACMASVSDFEMCKQIYEMRGLGVLHRFKTFEDKIDTLNKIKDLGNDSFNYIGMAIGLKDEDYKEVDDFVNLGVKILCLDVANSDCARGLDMIRFISKKYPHILLIAGTIATAEAAVRGWDAGADMLRVGVGSGSICTTRICSGVGVPQLSALMEVRNEQVKYNLNLKYHNINREVYIMSDGGCYDPGDSCKALTQASMIMAGNIFSGTIESPGEIICIDGTNYKNYNGSSTHKTDRIEGVKSLVPFKGPVYEVFKKHIEGIQSCCSYQNSKNLQELKERYKMIRITPAGLAESHPHHVKLR